MPRRCNLIFIHLFIFIILTLSTLLVPLQPLDYETRKAFTLKVEATNIRSEPNSGGPYKDTATVKIVVNDSDEPPVFSKPVYLLEVNENAAINTVIGTVTARDPDSLGSVVRYGTEYALDSKNY